MDELGIEQRENFKKVTNSDFIVSVINNDDKFLGIRDEWKILVRLVPNTTVFQTWEWLYTWWMVYGGEFELAIITVRKNGILIGLAPLYFCKTRGGCTEIRMLGANEVCSDYLDFIILPAYSDIIFNLFFCCLNDMGRWTRIHLTDVLSNSPTLVSISSFFSTLKQIVIPQHSVCPFVELSGTWQEIEESFSSRIKNIVRRKTKALSRNYSLKYVALTSQAVLDKAFHDFVSLNRLRMSDKQIRSPFLESSFLKFHSNVFKALFNEGMSDLLFLLVDQKPVAGIYLLNDKRRFYFYQAGFDTEWSKFSPGTLLLHHAVYYAYKSGAHEFDLLRGNEKYKSDWTSQKRITSNIIIYNDSLNAQFLFFKDKMFSLFKKSLKKILAISG